MADDNVIGIGSGGEDARKAWQRLCLRTDKGVLIPNLANAVIALRYDHAVRDVFAFDQMLCAPVMLHEIGQIATCHRPVEDEDVKALQVWLQHNGFPRIGLDAAHGAIVLRAHECAFHPVREYLNQLRGYWDGTKRIGVWLPRYLGAPFNAYTQHIGRMFLLQMVARIERPGCQADHMLVLEGPQGALKSSACRVLGGEWFSDHLPEISHDTRAASQHLRGKWLIEVSEMHAFNRAEATKLKSFITRTTEIYLARYGRMEVHEPRQCCFVGTTNEDQYLKDPSGGRRFWSLKCGVDAEIDIQRLAADRDQLFAEAVHCFDQNDPWWPDASFERELIIPEQAARYAADIWEDKLATFLSSRFEITVAEIALECFGIVAGQQTRAHEARISAILKEMGWSPKRTDKRRYWTQT